ncbi:FlgO family outer membrane protein [Roseospira navarrensis]|uniref:FlgO domain-containing protein n=1 Tax=Roseospira navarrensis TaxID=140058 RepID=A0A7X1ZCS2_9PROT|nr:FlgO family outer membrane protein [Roseospira navarrensis]MQX36178.1 hypothetical protein [Roseospira navarrensis]
MRSVLMSVLVAGAAVTALSACAPEQFPDTFQTERSRPAVDVEAASYQAADQLLELSHARLNTDKPIVVTTLVDNGDLTRAAPIGRLVAEQIATRLTNAGYTVREMRFGSSLKVREGTGELVLSRDLRDISRSVGAQAIVAGTYTPGSQWVFVNAKLIHATSGDVLSAADFQLRNDGNVQSLVAMPASDSAVGTCASYSYTTAR